LFERILILSPHTDDAELGCGGAIARLVEEGREVHLVAFSDARGSLGDDWPEDQCRREMFAAADKLGLPAGHVRVAEENFEVRHFPARRQEILERIVALRGELDPDTIFVPSPNDIHQDHQVIAQEGLRAFKRQTILGYEEPWNNVVFETRFFIPLEKRHVERKVEALRCYETQRHRSYLDAEFLWSLARTRGTQLESSWAEAFEVLRMVMP
jgi:LmbE family N-acetylglucosaminyl deacetylase